MSEVRIYVDEDACQLAVLSGLRARGLDVLSAEDAQMLGAADEAQLAFAVEQSRAIYTFNVDDFARLHREYLNSGTHHWGILLIPRQRYSIGGKVRQIANLLATTTAEELVDRIEYL
jgi:hypothetical protein